MYVGQSAHRWEPNLNQINPIEKKLLSLTGSVITGKKLKDSTELTPNQWQELMQLGERHKVTPILLDAVQNNEKGVPEKVMEYMTDLSCKHAYSYYQRVELTKNLLLLLQINEIPGVLLKGIGLCALYPRDYMRKTNDVDIYIWDREGFERFREVMLHEGFLEGEQKAQHHIEFIRHTGNGDFSVELHSKIIGVFDHPGLDNQIEGIFRNLDGRLEIEDVDGFGVPVLEPTLNALYLLLHMLRHFVYKGFGIRLLCDWMIFLSRRSEVIDFGKLWEHIRELKLETFTCAVTGICMNYFGFQARYAPFMDGYRDEDGLEKQLLSDIINGGDLGGYDNNRIRCGNEQGKGRGIASYFREIHRQMLLRYENAQKKKLLWPFYWCATAAAFLYEILVLRRGNIRKVMKSYHQRNQLYQKIYSREKDGK